jgi:hypothetical protein
MSKEQTRQPDGEIRQSQLITTFGPGVMVDLPDRSVVISGLDYWHGDTATITEERLRHKICLLFYRQTGTWIDIKLRTPPQPYANRENSQHHIEAFIFPCWFLGQIEESYGINKKYRTRPLRHWSALRHDDKFRGKKIKWVPVRFVQACINGHLSDIDWNAFAHNSFNPPAHQDQLWLDEAGSGNDFDEIFVRCECGARRPLAQTKLKDSHVLGDCQGQMPWLKNDHESCIGRIWDEQTQQFKETGRPEPNRLLVRSASNAYFSHTMSVISIPDKTQELYDALNEFYDGDLEETEDIDDLIRTIKKTRYAKLHPFDPVKIWEAIQHRRAGGKKEEDRSIKSVELESLLQTPLENSPEAQQNKSKEGIDFEAARRSPDSISPIWKPYLSQIVLIHRLREVIAQVGFTRFESYFPDVEDGELDINPRRAPLSKDIKWVPTIENKGEGIFLAFDTQAVETWVNNNEYAKQRNEELHQGYLTWLKTRGLPRESSKYPGLAYIMLHTLSHLLLTEISLDCGYSASAIKERVYAISGQGYGILLYTSTTGSEGSLGGLVNIGRNIENYLHRSLQRGRLCSNDPICAHHDPSNIEEDRLLHGAACHGCVLIAETSCENRNEFLDRALVVNTVAKSQAAFFPDRLSIS